MHPKCRSALTIRTVFICLARNPYRHLIRRWNWKTACLSAVSRSVVILMANIAAGLTGALGAVLAEACYRFLTAGFYGALNQAFRYVRPVWVGSATAAFIIPAVSDGLEFVMHRARGTPRLGATLAATLVFTVVATLLELYAMRHGVLVVGHNSGSLLQDLKKAPALIASFFLEGGRYISRRTAQL